SSSPRSPGRSAGAAPAARSFPRARAPAQVRTRTVRKPPDRPAKRIPSSPRPPVITTHPRSRMSTPAPQAGWTAPDGGRGHRRAPGRRQGGPRAGSAGGGVIQGGDPGPADPGGPPLRDPGQQSPPGGPGDG